MFVKQFVGLNKTRAIKRALDFWYKNYLNVLPLKQFILKCTWKRAGGEVIVIFRDDKSPQAK